MRITAEKAGRSIVYTAAGLMVMLCVLLFGGNTIISHAADITLTTNAKVRSQASTDSDVVGSVSSGTTLSVAGEVTGTDGQKWYQVSVNGATGYIRSDLATQSSSNMTQEEVERENSYTETSATVSESSVTSATVSTSSANVRKGPSKTDAPVTSVKSGTQVAVTGETVGADGNVWYQVEVSGKTGFIRSDLVDPDESSAEAAQEEAATEEMEGTDEEADDISEEDALEGENTGKIVRVISSKILPEDADLEEMTIDEATLADWADGEFYVLYTKDGNGGEGWYLYDLSEHQFMKINSLTEGDDDADGGSLSSLLAGNGRIIMVIVVALVVILILVCILLAVKLHGYQEYEYDDEEEDEDDEDDDEDEDDDGDDEEEDDEDDEDEERPVKKHRWSPKNFLARRSDDDEDEDDEDEEDDEEEDEDEDSGEEEYLDDDDFEFEFLNMDGKDNF